METRVRRGIGKRKELLLNKLKHKRRRSLKKEREILSRQDRKEIGLNTLVDSLYEEPLVQKFRDWCGEVNIELNCKLYIGRLGSCHELGVIAKETIDRGEILAKIPRSSLLNGSNCYLKGGIKECSNILSSSGNSWLPLLTALIGEYSLKGHSYWQPYLNLVPNNRGCPPPFLWDMRERDRLLRGTGLYHLVNQDLEKLEHDYRTIVEPFLIDCKMDESCYSLDLFKQVISFVMSYSFTDSHSASSFSSQTTMVPFVDLLNHHTNHHVELFYRKNYLELIAIRSIYQGEEVMNTFGQLPNYCLLRSHGFVEPNNRVDSACIPLCYLREVYLSSSDIIKFDTFQKENRWKELTDQEIFDDDMCCEVNRRGVPEKRLLQIIKLLTTEETGSLERRINLSSLTIEELTLLRRYIETCISHIPVIDSDSSKREEKAEYVRYASQMCQEHLKYLYKLMSKITSLLK